MKLKSKNKMKLNKIWLATILGAQLSFASPAADSTNDTNRDADIEAARKLAESVARETVGEKAVGGCFLTRVEAAAAVLELRVQAPDGATRDSVRTALLSKLAQRFNDASLAVGGERPTFM